MEVVPDVLVKIRFSQCEWDEDEKGFILGSFSRRYRKAIFVMFPGRMLRFCRKLVGLVNIGKNSWEI